MSRRSRNFRESSCFFGQDVQINCADLVPPSPLTKPIELDDDFRFLLLDVNARDTDYTHWISPCTTDKTVLELYSFLYMLNRIFYHADQNCCVFVQQKERLVPGNLLVRKEIVAGHILYFGFQRQFLEEILPTCITLALMTNANYLDAAQLFVSPLSVDVLKFEAYRYNYSKGVADSSKKVANSSGSFGSYKTLNELGRLLMNYHHVSRIETESRDSDREDDSQEGETIDRCRYSKLRRNMLQLLNTEDANEFANGLVTLLSGPFLFEHSLRMVRPYREMRDLVVLNGCEIGLDASQIEYVTTGEPAQFIPRVKRVSDAPALPIKSQVLLECLRNAVRRYHWQSVFRGFRLDLTGGLAWRVLDGHMQRPFDTPLYTMVFPREQVDKGMQLLREFIDQASLDKMEEMQRQLEAYGLVTGQERFGNITDVRLAATHRQGARDNVARKYPLFTDMRNLLEKLADVLQPGSKVRQLYRGPFAKLTGKLIEAAVHNPNKPLSKSLESLVRSYPTLVDGDRNFHVLHLNSFQNKCTGNYVVAVHTPFDDDVEWSDGLMINDFFTYSVAAHSKLLVEMVELRLAVTSGVAIDTKNIWVGWQGPAGSGKTTAAKSVLHGISESDGLSIRGMVREMDSTTTASLKSLNDDPFLHCNGVGFVNELNDGGNDKSGTLRDDSSEKSTLMKNFFDSGLSAVYRARVNENLNEVRQNVQHVIFDCVFLVLANHLSLCPSLRDRMVIHTINKTAATSDRMTVADIFQRMDRFKVGHYEILKLLVVSLVSMFEFVGCTLEDADYLADMERLTFYVMDQEFRAMHLDANFLGRGRLLDNIRSLVRMLAMHRAVLTVLGCVDTFRLPWEEHDDTQETLDEYNQRIMQMVVEDLKNMTLHELVRRVQEVFCPSPADYIAVATMECLDQNAYFPVYKAIARSLVDPNKVETSSDGRKVFVVPNMTLNRLVEVLNDERIPLEAKEIRNILEATMTSVTRDGIPALTITNQPGSRSREAGHGPSSLLQLSFDARMTAEVVIESDMMHLVNQLTVDIQEMITQVVNELPPHASHDPRFPGETITINSRPYGPDARRFFGFVNQLRPNKWTSRYADQVLTNFMPGSTSIQVSSDFNHARLKLMRRWLLECAEDPVNVLLDEGYVRVHQMNQCSVLVATILDVRVRETFRDLATEKDSRQSLLPFYKTGTTVYVHQALPILRFGIEEPMAARLRRICAPPDYPIEYWTFDAKDNPELLERLEATELSSIDAKYTTASDALVCEQDLDRRGSGAWLHLSILSRLEDVLSTTTASSSAIPRQFVTRCLRKDLTDRKTVLFFNKRGKGPPFDVIKVDDVRSAHGGHLPRVELPRGKGIDSVTASLAMMEEGHTSTLGVKREPVTTFPPQHETRYLTRKYLASTGKLREIEEQCAAIHGTDFDAREKAIHTKVEAMTDTWMERVKTRYRPLTLAPPLSSVEEFMTQDGEKMRIRSRRMKRKRDKVSHRDHIPAS